MIHRRFLVRDTPTVWADATSEYVFPGFNGVRGRLCGASLGDCDVHEVAGPVRSESPKLPEQPRKRRARRKPLGRLVGAERGQTEGR